MSRPYVPQGTNKRFLVPRTLAADFDQFLDQDIPNTVMDFELIHNWYEKFDENYRPFFIRGEIYPDSTKSRYENTDNNMNIRCSVRSGIRKGDMIIEPNGTVYLLDWEVHLQSNNAPSRALRCNMHLEVKRYMNAEVDDDGYVVNEDGFVVRSEKYDFGNDGVDEIIVHRIPANALRYDGRPEYVSVSGTPGTIPGALTIIYVQFNPETRNIHIGDKFDWANDSYEIVDIDYVGVNIHQTHGVIKLQCKRAAGGLHGYE